MSEKQQPQEQQPFFEPPPPETSDQQLVVVADPLATSVAEGEACATPSLNAIDEENKAVDEQDQELNKRLKKAEYNEKTKHSEFRASFPEKVWMLCVCYATFVAIVILMQGLSGWTGFHLDKEVIVALIDALKFIGGGVAATAFATVLKASLVHFVEKKKDTSVPAIEQKKSEDSK